MLSKVYKYIDSLSSIPHLEVFQEASQNFEKEREPWKQERFTPGLRILTLFFPHSKRKLIPNAMICPMGKTNKYSPNKWEKHQ